MNVERRPVKDAPSEFDSLGQIDQETRVEDLCDPSLEDVKFIDPLSKSKEDRTIDAIVGGAGAAVTMSIPGAVATVGLVMQAISSGPGLLSALGKVIEFGGKAAGFAGTVSTVASYNQTKPT